MLLMSTSMVLCSCGGGSANSSASQSASAEASAESAEDAAKKAEEEAAKKAEEEAKAAAEASRLAEEEAKKKAEEEAKAAEEALKKELEEYGIEAVEEGILVEIAAACAEEDYDAACALMRGEEYEAEAKALQASGEERRIVQTPSGRIGIYYAPNNASIFGGDYGIYYGEYAGDQRAGEGVWLIIDFYHNEEEYQLVVTCSWENNLPNGTFRKEEIVGDGHTVYEGKLTDAYYDGEITMISTGPDGTPQTTTTTYTNGYLTFGDVVLDESFVASEAKQIQVDYGDGTSGFMYDLDGDYVPDIDVNDGRIGRQWFIVGFTDPEHNR